MRVFKVIIFILGLTSILGIATKTDTAFATEIGEEGLYKEIVDITEYEDYVVPLSVEGGEIQSAKYIRDGGEKDKVEVDRVEEGKYLMNLNESKETSKVELEVKSNGEYDIGVNKEDGEEELGHIYDYSNVNLTKGRYIDAKVKKDKTKETQVKFTLEKGKSYLYTMVAFSDYEIVSDTGKVIDSDAMNGKRDNYSLSNILEPEETGVYTLKLTGDVNTFSERITLYEMVESIEDIDGVEVSQEEVNSGGNYRKYAVKADKDSTYVTSAIVNGGGYRGQIFHNVYAVYRDKGLEGTNRTSYGEKRITLTTLSYVEPYMVSVDDRGPENTYAHIHSWMTVTNQFDAEITSVGYTQKTGGLAEDKIRELKSEYREKSMVADPIDSFAGNYIDDNRTMLTYSGINPLQFSLSYDSIANESKTLGGGFTHNFETYLDIKDEGELDFYLTPNSVIKTKLEDGEYIPYNENQIGLNIVKNENGYVLTDKEQQKYEFDLKGNILKKTDKVGLTTNYIRNEEGILTKVNNDKGQEFNFTYNEEGKLVKVTDGEGRFVEFTYGSKGLTQVKLTNGTLFEVKYGVHHEKVEELKQDGNLIVKNSYDNRGRVSWQDDGNSVRTKFSYDEVTDNNVTTKITTGNTTETKVHDELGNLIKEIDGEGFITEYTYDKNRNVTSEKDKNGNKYTFEYDEFNRLIKEVNPDETYKEYKYDENNNIVEIVGEDGKSTKSKYENNRLVELIAKTGEVITYKYNNFGNVTGIVRDSVTITNTYDDKGNMTSIKNGDNLTKFKVDNLGRVIETEFEEGKVVKSEYDISGNVIKETDFEGNITTNEYNSYGDLIKQTDSNGVITNFEYDGNGNLTKETKGNRTVVNTYNAFNQLTKTVNGNTEDKTVKNTETFGYNKRGELSSYRDGDSRGFNRKYDGNGNVISETVGNSVETFEYDTLNNLIKSVDGNGNITLYNNDINGNVVKETLSNGVELNYEYDIKGRLISETDGNGNKTYYEYDNRNNLTKETLSDGSETQYIYNKLNQQTKVINALSEELSYEYNNLGQLIKVVNNNEDDILVYEYDKTGNVVGITNGNGNKYTINYDLYGNVIKIIDALGNEIETNEYNIFNELISTANSLQNVNTYNYDDYGRLVRDIDSEGNETKYNYSSASRLNKTTNALGTTAEYKYNDFGNIVMLGQYFESRTDYTEDNNQNVIKDKYKAGELNYSYDSVNNLITKINARKQNINYEYDNNGNLIKETTPEGEITYEYDSLNNLIKSEDTISDITITREYDKLGRVLSKTQNKETIKYKYDNLGNLIELTYPNNKTVKYTYDLEGNILTVKDWNNKETKYEYDNNGRLIKTINDNGVIEERSYDSIGQLTKLESKLGDKVITSENYEYSSVGNIVQENDKVFNYDALNRLVETNNSSYKYSSFGNITEFNTNLDDKPYQLLMKYGYDNELNSLDKKAVEVDKDGNLLTYTLNGVKYSADYDSLNRMTSFDGLNYEYDSEGNRIKVSESDTEGKETTFVVDNDNLNSKYSQVLSEETEGKVKYHIYGNGLIGSYEKGNEDNEEYSFITNHYDIRGSTISVTDNTGKVTGTVEYNEYGKVLSKGEEITTSYLYNGKYGVQTDSNNLNYMRNRYYNPDLMRFMNRDIVIGSIEESQTINRYSYSNGDPISYNDPFGLARESVSDNGWLSNLQSTLDVAGLIPGYGIVPDLLNATIYLGTGNYSEALWSGIGAVPIVGDSISGVRKANKVSKVSGVTGKLSPREMRNARTRGVNRAWSAEKKMVKEYGFGTRRWTEDEVEMLLKKGRVKGYEGHHMKSVEKYPEYADDPDNIQFLKGRRSEFDEHLDAHKGNYKISTDGYYNPETRKMVEFEGGVPWK